MPPPSYTPHKKGINMNKREEKHKKKQDEIAIKMLKQHTDNIVGAYKYGYGEAIKLLEQSIDRDHQKSAMFLKSAQELFNTVVKVTQEKVLQKTIEEEYAEG